MIAKLSSWHVAIAAEAIAAAQFARCRCDVSVQYGADQPEYDLIVARGDRMLKVSVKGSQDGAWGLTQSYLKNANYHGAIDAWLLRHGAKTVFCLVQLKSVALDALPRVYLARPKEIAERLRESAAGRGETILYEEHRWGPRAKAAGQVEEIPTSWRLTLERVDELFAAI